MSTTLRQPMSRDAFFAWVELREERYEFDGEQPVLMTGGTMLHSRMVARLLSKLVGQLEGSRYEAVAQDAGVDTSGQRIRYPDIVISDGQTPASSRLVEGVVAVFEVVSPSSSRIDRIVKLREYGEVEGILHYVIFETESPAATMFRKHEGAWIAVGLTVESTLSLPALNVELPLSTLYAGLVV